MKKILLSSLGILLLGVAANAQNIVYSNDFTTVPTVTGSGAFVHASDGTNWTIDAPTGHGEWDQFDIAFPAPIDFSVAGNHPTVTAIASSNQTVAFEVLLVDDKGHITDVPLDLPGQPLFFNIIKDEAPKAFSYSFKGKFTDKYGNAGAPQGAVDSTKIVSIRFKINPGWAKSPYTYHVGLADEATYKVALTGTVKIDKLVIGGASVGISEVNTFDKFSVFPNPSNGLVSVTKINSNSDVTAVSVADILGKEVYSSKVNDANFTIDLTGKEKGIYFISMQSKRGVVTKKMILN